MIASPLVPPESVVYADGMTPTPTTAPAMFAIVDLTKAPGAIVHIGKASRHPGAGVTFCTGRTVQWMVGTDQPVTCKACIKRAAGIGVDASTI